MHYDHNQFFGLLKFQSGYRKFYLNSPTGYGRKIINSQTDFIIKTRLSKSGHNMPVICAIIKCILYKGKRQLMYNPKLLT